MVEAILTGIMVIFIAVSAYVYGYIDGKNALKPRSERTFLSCKIF